MPSAPVLAFRFQSTLPARGATSPPAQPHQDSQFQSTLPARGATNRCCVSGAGLSFQSTLPARGATRSSWRGIRSERDFNPRSPHGERLVMMRSSEFGKISIHAPRTGSDVDWCFVTAYGRDISIHAPRTGSDIDGFNLRDADEKFQSTLPARGATMAVRATGYSCRFQSTLPARGATHDQLDYRPHAPISIHAPRTGSDGADRHTKNARPDFNPRSPHGERRKPQSASCANGQFQSTLPARGATP